MSSRSALDRSLRRIKPEKQRKRLQPPAVSTLPLLSAARPPYPKLLLDTTVYIDVVQGVQPLEVAVALRTADLWHCTVTESELAALSGLLHPDTADLQSVLDTVAGLIDSRPAHRILNPDREIWRDAGILAGLLARLQGYGKSEQRKALNDALIFLTALKHGCTVLTRNVSDFDLLQQLEGAGNVLFYSRP